MNPNTPASCSGRRLAEVAGHGAAPEADVDVTLPLGGGPLHLPARPTSTVGGIEFSGMSTIVVTPPAAAARVARGEALPLGAARLVDVHVAVDEARAAAPRRRAA